jgi:hypothetical protein
MKNFLYATTGIALALALAGTATPASADVDVFASISKDKDITITENITITKFVTIVVASTFEEVPGGAEAQALLNVDNHGNEVNGATPGDPLDQTPDAGDEYNIHLSAVIGEDTLGGSINDNTGVFGFNQDVGNMTNQANVVSVAGISELPSFADAQAHVDQLNTDNTSTEFEALRDLQGELITDPTTTSDQFLVNKLASITDSVNDNTGIIGVNQNSGNMNNQSNAVAAAVGLGAVVALSEGDLGQETSHNHVDEVATVKTATIDGSINGNSGIVNVNQSTGNMNNQGNVVSLAAITSGAFINTNNAP